MTEYQPQRKEVFQEMLCDFGIFLREDYRKTQAHIQEAKQKVNPTNVKRFLKGGLEFGLNLVGTFVAIAVVPYVLPSVIKSCKKDQTPIKTKFTLTENICLSTGILTGLASWGGQAALYNYACENNSSEALLIPLITNLASGAYEILKPHYERTKNKLIRAYESRETK
jgi:hypothetical protein